ncbi:MAG: imidazole glycerol phosphate synthase subunit HisH [Anaerolineales bacterium]
MITIVDYGMGNLRSVYNALDLLGAEVNISSDPAEILNAERLILPGVGAFGLAMQFLDEGGFVAALNEAVIERGVPILAICLGMQLLAEDSTEHGQHAGLGWLPGQVRHFEAMGDLRVPHVGWNEIAPREGAALFQGVTRREFYFVHSYYFMTSDASIIAATTHYGHEFVSAVQRDNIFGTQFHPEKSQDAGLRVLRNFMAWERATEPA